VNTAAIVALVVGFFVGNLAFASVARWLYGLWEILRAQEAPPQHAAVASRLIVGTALSSGPWVLVILAVIAYHVSSEPWASWLFTGFAAAIAFFGFLALHLWRKRKARPPEMARADQMLDRRAQPPKRSDIALAYIIGLVCGLVTLAMVPGGFDAPLFVWVFAVIWGILLGYMGHRMLTDMTGPKPWVERRKTPKP
jgi:hypothetical protein